MSFARWLRFALNVLAYGVMIYLIIAFSFTDRPPAIYAQF